MGCMDKESCPTLFVDNLLEWGIEEPKRKINRYCERNQRWD
jgi:hypothetical protein